MESVELLILAFKFGAALWVVTFGVVLWRQYRKAAAAPAQAGGPDPVARTLEAAAKWGIVTAFGALVVYSVAGVLDRVLGLGLGLVV